DGPAEATATIVQRTLDELGLQDEVLLWNVVPTHPGTARSNRAPTRAEIEGGLPFARRLARGRRVIAVGRLAESALDSPYVRHPAHGGATAFAHMLALATLATPSVQMVDRQFNVARMVVETRRRCRRPYGNCVGDRINPVPNTFSHCTDTRLSDRRQRLGLAHPRIDANYRSTIYRTESAAGHAGVRGGTCPRWSSRAGRTPPARGRSPGRSCAPSASRDRRRPRQRR